MSSDYHWHVERSKKILNEHPEIKRYFGNYSWSIIFIVILVAVQWFMAWLVHDLPWWTVGLIALFLGQFIMHSLATFIHEASHNLILRGRWGTLVSLFIIELGAPSFGKSLDYLSVHGPAHHLHLNDYQKDYEWQDKKQAAYLVAHPHWRFISGFLHLLPGGSVVSDLIFSWIVPSDTYREIKGAKKSISTVMIFILSNLFFYVLVWQLLGWKAILYFLWCLTIMTGHWGVTFRGQSISEHHNFQDGKTYSTYHWTNFVFFNTGYHDEHHTFPNVAWVHLPKIRQIAPEYFKNESPHSYFGWWWLWVRSIFNPEQSNRYSAEKILVQKKA
ncbi:fatty acid desaturase [Lyngbya confervoides]|uniref:Fatty acid desaturase n=1 Tax=Lyngbya confervoides BDU141951 TaxID=1574623 RepID=A0ABD4T5W1_9CYAN|nr:fatty acid desaturase [Lyngbya confervoides]MCM1984069.1 fatty acid desaturase [Lyngbya confervoides BDU141951]